MAAAIVKPDAQGALERSVAVSEGNTRLAAFLTEFREALVPLLTKHGLELPTTELLHHRGADGARAYAVLHFYVFATPVQSKP